MSTFTINLTSNAAELARNLGQFRGLALQQMAEAMDNEHQATIRYIGDNKLSRRGPKTLGRVSSTLLRSLRGSKTRVSSSGIESALGTNLEYAGVHEYGTRPYVIRPKNRRFLRFSTPRGIIFAKQVNHPGFPARRWLSTGIQERESNYSAALSKAIEEAWSR